MCADSFPPPGQREHTFWEDLGGLQRIPHCPSLPLPFYHVTPGPFIQNDSESLLLIFLSLQVINSHPSSSFKWKFENTIWKRKKKITHVISGAGLMEQPFQEAGCEVLGGSNRDALKDSVLTWAELFLHLQLTAVLVVGSQQLLKRERGRANHFHDCHTGSLLCWKRTSRLLGLHIFY